jgi:hypothetical protein
MLYLRKTLLPVVAVVILSALICGNASLAIAQEGSFPLPGQEEMEEVTPVNPVHKVYDEENKIVVAVGTPRAFGYRIGDVIPVTIVISTSNSPNCQVDIKNITRKVISAEGSDFEMVESSPDGEYPKITIENANGKTIHRIELKLRSWVIKPYLVFNADFLWATSSLPFDDKAPEWYPGTTPDLIITTSNTASDVSKELLDGDTSGKPSPVPPLVLPLRGIGVLLVALLPLWFAWLVFRYVYPPRIIPPHELAWNVFDKVFKKAPDVFNYEQVQTIAATLRAYLHVESVELNTLRFALEDSIVLNDKRNQLIDAAYNALSICEKALYSKSSLTSEESAQLKTEIELLVPRP